MKAYATEQRRLLLDYFIKHSGVQVSIKDIAADSVISENISLSSLYRNLDKMVDKGVIQKYAGDNNREFVYQYLDGKLCGGHLHLKCTICGKIYHMDDATTQKMFETVYKENRFSIDGQKTMLYGICSSCSE